MGLTETLTERRKKGAIEHIATTALELFLRDGFDATSVETIATATGCSARTFYRYFGTKEDVAFHDLPAVMERLGRVLDGFLADGLDPWAAACEAVLEFISRFDVGDRRLATQRTRLWLDEPALRNRYLQYVNHAEQVIADRLHRHRGTARDEDDLPQLIAITTTGAYRVTMLTHSPFESRNLAEHLRTALAAIGVGFAGRQSTSGAAPDDARAVHTACSRHR